MKKRLVKKTGELEKMEKVVEKELVKKRSLKDILGLIIIFLVICLTTFFITVLILFGKINLNIVKHKVTSDIFPKIISIQDWGSFESSLSVERSLVAEEFDPYELILKFDKNETDFTLVDLREKELFLKEHIKTAISFPVNPSLKNKTDNVNDLINMLYQKDIGKYVIVYGDFSSSRATKEIAGKLKERGLPAYALSIGWNEWRHFRNLWLPESKWNEFDASKYLTINEE